jgi:hypothetical protein
MNDPKEQNFDWVGARMKCSAHEVLRAIQADVKKSIETRNNTLEGPAFKYEPYAESGTDFYITSGQDHVLFRAIDENTISAARKQTEGVWATLTLDDDGICRLKVGNDRLLRWQFLKKVLEDFLFQSL